jgi:RND family efflux transporter MFP subunit
MNDGSRWKRIILVVAAVAATLSGCQGGGGDPLDAFASTATVARGTIADVVRMAGQVVAVNSRQLTMGTTGGRVSEVLVHPGQEVQQGQALVRLDTLELERKLREAEADLEVAEAVLAEAERQAGEIELAKAEADLAYAEYELAAAKLEWALAEQAGLLLLEEAVTDAEVALQVAGDQLRMKEIGANRSTIRSLEYDQGFYQRTLRDLPTDDGSRGEIEKRLGETERDLGRARATREDALSAGREEVEKKEEALATARTRLARAQSGEEDPTNAARLAHKQAQAIFEKAGKRVEELRAGGESEALRAVKAAHEAALAEVESAKADLAAATLQAPFDGIVLALYVQADDRVQPSDNVMYLADLEELRVQAEVTEMDVPHLAVGQYVRITFDAYPGQLFSGEVLSLPLRGRGQGGLSFYQVETSLARDGTDIRLGMLANVRVVIGERYNVLTVPVAALVYRTPDEILVKVRGADGKTHEQRVEIGLNDGILAEVLSGLSEGQIVLVPLVPPTEPFGPGPPVPIR